MRHSEVRCPPLEHSRVVITCQLSSAAAQQQLSSLRAMRPSQPATSHTPRPHQMRRCASPKSGTSGLIGALYQPPACTRVRTLALLCTAGRLCVAEQLKGGLPL